MTREEAIKNIKLFFSGIGIALSNKTKEAFNTLIPELAESEDERIRKRLITLIRVLDSSFFTGNNPSKEQCLAYLEKQKDASKAIEAVDRIDKYIDEQVANAHDMKDSNPDKKYYQGWDDALGEMAGILQDVYSDEKQKEQKPIEWSDNDDQLIGFIFDLLNDLVWRKDLAMSKEECLERLKSLRPSWKPSEEQIKALKYAAYHMLPGEEYRDILFSLLKDLTKLI